MARMLVRCALVAVVASVVFTGLTVGPAAAWRGPSGATEADPPSAESDVEAIELRVLLGQLLGEHAFLLMDAMRATALDEGSRAVLLDALDDNSAQLRDAIGLVYGDAGADQFAQLWDHHVDLLLAYAEARTAGDTDAAEAAEQELQQYAVDFGAFLATANPDLVADNEAAALELHVEQLQGFSDTDYRAAYEAQREAFEHMFDLGDHLALGIARQFPDRFAGGAVAFSPRSDLRLTLDRLLSEHLVLAAQTMRAGVAGSGDFEAGRSVLQQNTEDLGAAVASIYGPQAGAAFEELWRAHIDAYIEFVGALGADDEDARATALARLHDYHDDVAQFLAGANPELEQEAVADLVSQHVQALITQAEAVAAGDDARAVATMREAYRGTFEIGAALAEAIALQFPDRFEDLRALPHTAVDDQHRPEAGGVTALAATLCVLGFVGLVLSVPFRARRGGRRAAPR